ncbi:MAG: sigma-70 family RNA polymerase sigma factor [Oscillospiraceae bacterium]|jgi:RNA polymerase sigma factor (sigma-70 family)|nr:sigma-70 family RNA polymerase sigma factor [Oscillospiraceae bacterium]
MFDMLGDMLKHLFLFALHPKSRKDLADPMDKEEEKRLIVMAQHGNAAARNTVAEHNQKLILSIAERYYSRVSYMDTEDLFQVGMMYLDRAIMQYDASRGTAFSTVAGLYATRGIYMELRGIKSEPLTTPIDSPINEDADGKDLFLSDILSDTTDTEQLAYIAMLKIDVHNAIAKFPVYQRELIELRYGFSGKAYTLEELAAHFGKKRGKITSDLNSVEAKLENALMQYASEYSLTQKRAEATKDTKA